MAKEENKSQEIKDTSNKKEFFLVSGAKKVGGFVKDHKGPIIAGISGVVVGAVGALTAVIISGSSESDDDKDAPDWVYDEESPSEESSIPENTWTEI